MNANYILTEENNKKISALPSIFVCISDGKIDCIGDTTKIEHIEKNDSHMPENDLYIGYYGGWIRCNTMKFLSTGWTMMEGRDFNTFLKIIENDSDYWDYNFGDAKKDVDWNKLVDEMFEFLED